MKTQTLNKHADQSTVSLLKELRRLITQGLTSFIQAGEVVVVLIDQKGMTTTSIAEKYGDNSGFINSLLITRLERLGRGLLLPEIMTGGYPAAARLIDAPIEIQKKALQGIKAIVNDEVVKVHAKDLTESQCRQVFRGNRVNTLAEQHDFIRRGQLRVKTKANKVSGKKYEYRILAGRATFTVFSPGEFSLTLKQVEDIYRQLIKRPSGGVIPAPNRRTGSLSKSLVAA